MIRLVIFHQNDAFVRRWSDLLATTDVRIVRGDSAEDSDPAVLVDRADRDGCVGGMRCIGVPSTAFRRTVLWLAESAGEIDPRRPAMVRRLGRDVEDVWIGPMTEEELRLRLDLVRRRSQEMERLREMAVHDPLTGLLTRWAFGTLAIPSMAAMFRGHRPGTLVFCDIDQFKRINDTYGHAVGDMVLKSVGDRLRESLRQSDLISRWGGDEFVLWFPDTSSEDAEIPMTRVCDRLRKNEIPISLSIGTSPCPDVSGRDGVVFSGISAGVSADSETFRAILETAIARADAAMYRSRNRRVTAASESMVPELTENVVTHRKRPPEG
ncbi:MAG: GGDEF domain-containing protein [Planctomycetia bacterium]|nr:GGDEF domain-containing protein [Planctomycetia bacterium]